MEIPTRRSRVATVLALLAFLPLVVEAQPPADATIAGPPISLAAQIDLETALQWTLQSNPNLVATRQNERVSAEAVAVSRLLSHQSQSLDFGHLHSLGLRARGQRRGPGSRPRSR